MQFRFIRALALFAVAAGAFAGLAHALDFDDEDPHPPHPEIGLLYHYEIGTHAGCIPHRVVVLSGQLPPGLKLTQIGYQTALVDGIATQSGTFSVWLAVKDCDNRSAETLFTFEVWERRWWIATQALKPATVGSAYSFTLEAAGIPSNTTWEVTAGSLPAGLTLSKEGVISGTATAAGSSRFTVKATGNAKDFTGTRVDSREFTLNVTQPLAARLSRSTAEVGIPVRSTLVAAGGQSPYTWSVTGLPAGLSLGPGGALSGVPTRAGSYTVTAHLVDANGAVTDVQLRLVVRARLAIATKRLPVGTAGHAYRVKLAVRGGVPGLRWAIASGALPRGLRLAAATGTISGTPASAGAVRLTLRVRDALGAVSTKTLALTVR
jgi:Putative Ig domain